MSVSQLRVTETQLEGVVGYLDGLAIILSQLHAEKRGQDGEDALLSSLEPNTDLQAVWAPLRYQYAVGEGWAHVARNVRNLADSLRSEPRTEP